MASTLANTQTIGSVVSHDTREEPPLKKFKALFDASHPDQKSSAQDTDAAASLDPSSSQFVSQGGSETQSGGTVAKSVRDTRLSVLAEEEESTPTQARGIKRKPAAENSTRMNIDVGAVPLHKRRAQENVNAVQPVAVETAATQKPPSSTKRTATKSGAIAGKPDMDTDFLKAIASTKKGKKAEDAFDREFNKLKISKPDVQREQQETEWAVLDDFGDDRGIRGNFMVVMEMEIYSKGNNGSRRNEVSGDWSARPNFKKFKKVLEITSSMRLQLTSSIEIQHGCTSQSGPDGP